MTVPFADHVALFDQFLTRRREIVERLDSQLLNVRGKDITRNRDRRHFERLLNACFFDLARLPPELAGLKGQLAARHMADGFAPIQADQYANELDPLQLIVYAYGYWDHHRWPGSSGRLTYAGTIYAVFILRQLEYLSLRIWDDGNEHAGDRLRDVQHLLDRLNAPVATSVFVRDARWLMQTAQGPLTRYLHPYFEVADRIAGSLTESSRLEIHRAGAALAGGHLRSRLRYRMWETGRSLDDPEILAITRNSNSMDNAMLVRDLVPLLDAYRTARTAGNKEGRLHLADVILQGLSADPELLLSRLDLLEACTTLEELFLQPGADGRPGCTPRGEAHRALLERYGQLIGELAAPLKEDAQNFDPSQYVYSPYGMLYGFSGDLLTNMALGSLLAQPSFGQSLEDVFVSRNSLDEKLARARGWSQLPKRDGERAHGEHSPEWAIQMFARLVDALDARARHTSEPNASGRSEARLFVVPDSRPVTSLPAGVAPTGAVLAQDDCYSTDPSRALSTGATLWPRNQMLNDRTEGRFLASAEIDGHWFAVSKVVLSLFTSQGQNVLITDVPQSVVDVLLLAHPRLVVVQRS
jgi:hypothetical protein